MFAGPLEWGVVARACARGTIGVRIHDLRDFADPPRRGVDDEPYGGGAGMLFRPEPLARAIGALRIPGARTAVVRMDPAGELLSQALARELGEYEQVVVLCDRYEGSDARVGQEGVTHEVSIGDYVLTGGELAAMVLVDVVARTVEGVVGKPESVGADSFAATLLEHEQFTRPETFRDRSVPDVLRSGDHARIESWRRRSALRRTLERRPDLLDGIQLDEQQQKTLEAEMRPRAAMDPGKGTDGETRSCRTS